jgi:hypothetical protein
MSEERAEIIAELAKKMGDAGYCNYAACTEYLELSYAAGKRAGGRELEEALRETMKLARELESTTVVPADRYESILHKSERLLALRAKEGE